MCESALVEAAPIRTASSNCTSVVEVPSRTESPTVSVPITTGSTPREAAAPSSIVWSPLASMFELRLIEQLFDRPSFVMAGSSLHVFHRGASRRREGSRPQGGWCGCNEGILWTSHTDTPEYGPDRNSVYHLRLGPKDTTRMFPSRSPARSVRKIRWTIVPRLQDSPGSDQQNNPEQRVRMIPFADRAATSPGRL